MARYKLNTYHYRHARKFFKRIKVMFIVLGIILTISAIVIVADSLFQEKQSTTPTDTTTETKTSFYASDQIFRTAYFQIQAPKSWIAIPDDGTATKFVYRGMQKNLVQQELDILVDGPVLNPPVTRVLPVEVSGNSLVPKGVSVACGTTLPKNNTNRNPQTMTLNNIQITCVPDSNQYDVIVGLANGSTVIKMQRPDGKVASYQILYKNVTVNPDPRDLISIIESFQTR